MCKGQKLRSSDDDILKNFNCESIKINNVEIFSEKQKYVIAKDEVKNYQTVKFDEIRNFPNIAENISGRRKYIKNEICRIQQHILIHIINNKLCEIFF